MRQFIFTFFIFSTFICSCKKQETKGIESEIVSNSNQKIEIKIIDGKAEIRTNNELQIIELEGEILAYHLSPDQKKIAFDVAQLSTLNVVKLFELKANKFVPIQININTIAWKTFDKKHKTNLEEFSRSSVTFSNWKKNNSIEMILNCENYDGKNLSDTLTLPLSN